MVTRILLGCYRQTGRKDLSVPKLDNKTGKIKLTVDRNSGKIEFGKIDPWTG